MIVDKEARKALLERQRHREMLAATQAKQNKDESHKDLSEPLKHVGEQSENTAVLNVFMLSVMQSLDEKISQLIDINSQILEEIRKNNPKNTSE